MIDCRVLFCRISDGKITPFLRSCNSLYLAQFLLDSACTCIDEVQTAICNLVTRFRTQPHDELHELHHAIGYLVLVLEDMCKSPESEYCFTVTYQEVTE